MNRKLWVLIHRWAGLAMAGFLILVGLTGSLLAFYPELERAMNPHWYVERDPADWRDAASLVERLEADDPRARVVGLAWQDYAGVSSARISAKTNPETGQPYALEYHDVVFDPATGATLDRVRGSFEDGGGHLMGFVYSLHYSLALEGFGVWVLGIVALVWTLDCFVGVYLTLPRRRYPRPKPPAPAQGRGVFKLLPPARGKVGMGVESLAHPHSSTFDPHLNPPPARGRKKNWWQRWKPAWKVKRSRLNFDLHRAGGLWLWAMLLVFAWSSVAMDLWNTVYTWTTRAVLEYRPEWTELPPLERPLAAPGMSWREAQATGDRLLSEQAQHWDFRVLHPVELAFDADRGVFEYRVRTDREIEDRSRYWGSTRIFFSASDGHLRHFMLPRGQYAGNTVSNWLYALHMANVFGLPYRIFVSVLGLAIAILSVTGIVIWLRKRRARTARATARPSRAPGTSPSFERARP